MKKNHRLLKLCAATAITAGAIAVINKRILSSSVMKNLLRPKREQYYDWRFGKIFYTKEGNGKPLLLIHDLTPYSSNYEWTTILDSLKEKYTVYCIDLLGCGLSDKPKITYTNFLYVQLINDFINHIVGKPCDVIASGLSSSFVFAACKNNPEALGKIMAINPVDLAGLNKIPTTQRKLTKHLLELPLLGTLLYNIITSKNNIELLFTEKYMFNPFHTSKKLVETYYEAAHRGNDNGKYLLSSIFGYYMYMNISNVIKDISHPVCLIGGEKEEGIRETFALYESLNLNFENHLIGHSKHLPQIEAPEILLDYINYFFN